MHHQALPRREVGSGVIPHKEPLLKGSWDLVTRVIIKVTILIITYNPTKVLITLLTKRNKEPLCNVHRTHETPETPDNSRHDAAQRLGSRTPAAMLKAGYHD